VPPILKLFLLLKSPLYHNFFKTKFTYENFPTWFDGDSNLQPYVPNYLHLTTWPREVFVRGPWRINPSGTTDEYIRPTSEWPFVPRTNIFVQGSFHVSLTKILTPCHSIFFNLFFIISAHPTTLKNTISWPSALFGGLIEGGFFAFVNSLVLHFGGF